MRYVLFLLGLLLAVPAAAQTPTTYPIIDGSGTTRNFRAVQESNQSLASQNVLEMNGNLVSASNPLPVSIPTPMSVTQSGTVTVTGAGGTFPSTQSGTWNMRLQDGSGTAVTSDTRGSERPLSVQVLDASGNQITAFDGRGGAISSGTNTQIIQADSSAVINSSAAGTTQLVSLVAGKKIYVTSFNVVAGGTGTFQLEYGTGSNCATGTVALTGPYPLASQAGAVVGGGLGPVLVVPSGNALCVVNSANVQMSGSVAYTQY